MIVAKVGGSLYDDPRLGPGLRAWLAEQREPVTLVPGGGAFADAVRDVDRVHGLGEESAHWLAIRSLSVAAHFLETLLGQIALLPPPPVHVLDCYDFFRRHDLAPHTWDVTTDSLAAAVASQLAARKLVLLKSVDIPPVSWGEAAANGWVDPHFPTAVDGASYDIAVVNFRRWLDERFGPANSPAM